MRVTKCPSDTLSMTNRVVVNKEDWDPTTTPHLQISTGPGQNFIMSCICDPSIPRGSLGFGINLRKWAVLSIDQEVAVSTHTFNMEKSCISTVTLEIDFFSKKNATCTDEYNSDLMAAEFTSKFANMGLSVGQQLVFGYNAPKFLSATVTAIEATDLRQVKEGKVVQYSLSSGVLIPNSAVVFNKAEGSQLKLTGKRKGKMERQAIINPDWDFTKMGVGGLDEEFNAIFRRAFASRVFPPEIMEQLGCSHVKGILLHGPPGTGKTLMARQIGKMLNATEPKIVNGPEILDKYVGEAEKNIRNLFIDAEADEARLGANSPLHIIIFDEIDAICKKRGSVAGSSGVNDTVVNQLLSKIDGVDTLNNILVIGMTNRPDMIDEALTRPGRLEVSIEIGLPNEPGRVQIINIHTRTMVQHKKMAKDVDLLELATLTKNFSGAELEGLVRAAQSCALNRLVKADAKVEVDLEAAEELMVTRADFLHALKHDVKPALGSAEDLLQSFLSRGIVDWSPEIASILADGELLLQQAASTSGPGLVSILIEGAPNSGKSALAATLASKSGFPFVKVCSPEDMVGFTESAKCAMIRKIFDDAYRSERACLLVDNIERLLDYGPIGPRYSNTTLQALLVLFKKVPPKGRRLLILATSSQRAILDQMEMIPCFTDVLHVPNLSTAEHLMAVIRKSGVVGEAGLSDLSKSLSGRRANIGVKKLLGLLDMVAQTGEGERARKLLAKLEEEMFVEYQ